ncbi:hypothetical protein AHAS_Ahas10G0117300 [Arachis hypogaea]
MGEIGAQFQPKRSFWEFSQYIWKVGILYMSRQEFKDCSIIFAVHSDGSLRFVKVDLRWMNVTCVEGYN